MSTHSLTERYLAEDVYEDVALPDWIRLKMYPGMDAGWPLVAFGAWQAMLCWADPPKVLGMLENDDTLPPEKRIPHREVGRVVAFEVRW